MWQSSLNSIEIAKLNYKLIVDKTRNKIMMNEKIWNVIVKKVARRTGLEPATPGVTGRYSNQLNYRRAYGGR